MSTQANDLAALRSNAAASPLQPAADPPRRRWRGLVLLLLGLVLICGFGVLTAERWIPVPGLRVARVATLPASSATEAASSGGVIFQAAGWIEPAPLPVRATGLVSGVVSEVLVLEGERVAQGQVLARLDPAEFRLDLERARAELALTQARAAEAAQAQAVASAERLRLDARLAAADARIAEQADLADRLTASERAFSERQRSQAQLALATARAERAAVAAEAAGLDAAIERARAQQQMVAAEQRAAQSALQQAELALERTEIRSPIDGVIQVLHALPGRTQMLGSDHPEGATVAELYDPAQLQARIDVSLADAAGLATGQRVELQCEALPEQRFAGHVSRIVGAADIARNTLQAKVALEDPHPLLRPGMLVRARFMGEASAPAQASGQDSLRLVLPASLPGIQAHTSAELWVVGEQQRILRQQVRLGGTVGSSGIEVLEGLLPGALVVLDPPAGLAAGDRVAVAEVVE